MIVGISTETGSNGNPAALTPMDAVPARNPIHVLQPE
ncbi:hypothetical protein BH23GEM3_BH23GEM3_12060 [soil metagenome]